MRRTWGIGAAALLLTACGGGSLEADDSAGYQACELYAEAAQINDDPVARMGASFEAGERASEAETPAIRAAAQQVGDSWITDGDALSAACEENGYDIP